MHSRTIDLARSSTCSAYAEDDLNAARGVVWWLVALPAVIGCAIIWAFQ